MTPRTHPEPIPPAHRWTGRCECCQECACQSCKDAPRPLPAEPHHDDREAGEGR